MMILIVFAAGLGLSQPTLESCRTIVDPTERLACYDSLTLSPTAAPEVAPGRPQLEAPKSEEQRRAEFEESTRQIRAGTPPSIVSAAAQIEKTPNGKLRITLENGQVWRQLSSDRPYHVSKKAPPKMATITEAAMGSYRLKFDNNRQSIRVRREK
ncbi:MAG: hypothetical protein AAGA69_00010 [Pseudomonadota bacterium]